MEAVLQIKSTEDSPEILFDKSTGQLTITGKSLPEDAFGFYQSAIEWLSDYIKSPQQLTQVTFNLEYFNTASSKQIFKLISLLKDLSKTHPVKITWHFDKGDKDMQSSGERFSKLCQMPIDVIQN
jgi:hypothetical protein